MKQTLFLNILDIILEGLPQELESNISLINGKFGSISIEEVEILLLCHVTRLDHFHKKPLVIVNIPTTFAPITSNSSTAPQANLSQIHEHNYESNVQPYGGQY